MTTTTEPTYVICPACLDHHHTDCTLGAKGGKTVCGCDNAAHPDHQARALHTRHHSLTPDYGPTAPADTGGAPPPPLAPGVHLKPGAIAYADGVPLEPTVTVVEGGTVEDGVVTIEGDTINEADTTEPG